MKRLVLCEGPNELTLINSSLHPNRPNKAGLIRMNPFVILVEKPFTKALIECMIIKG